MLSLIVEDPSDPVTSQSGLASGPGQSLIIFNPQTVFHVMI